MFLIVSVNMQHLQDIPVSIKQILLKIDIKTKFIALNGHDIFLLILIALYSQK